MKSLNLDQVKQAATNKAKVHDTIQQAMKEFNLEEQLQLSERLQKKEVEKRPAIPDHLNKHSQNPDLPPNDSSQSYATSKSTGR